MTSFSGRDLFTWSSVIISTEFLVATSKWRRDYMVSLFLVGFCPSCSNVVAT